MLERVHVQITNENCSSVANPVLPFRHEISQSHCEHRLIVVLEVQLARKVDRYYEYVMPQEWNIPPYGNVQAIV